MNKFRQIVVLVALALTVVTGPHASAKTLAEIKKAGVLRIGTEGTFPPFTYYKGKLLTGFEIELVELIAKDLGLKAEWKVQNFDTLLIGLGQNRFDLVASSHGVTPDRAKVVDFTTPHYCTGGVILTRSDKRKSFDSIKNGNVVVQVGTTYVTWLNQHGLKSAKTFPTATDCLQNMLMGRADAWVTDLFVALDAMKANPNAKLVLGDTIFTEKIAMAVAKGNKELLAAVNDTLAKLKKDGRYAALSDRYFGQNIDCK
ncbi:MAG TPA: ABC transporter substrate-binding protein [Bdellovibrionota bacterium]|jgi:polar amino acid transport system substrate-binding protein|nr:ABC transporter substrate-binding protein [Bdellovibrionota bacterium]